MLKFYIKAVMFLVSISMFKHYKRIWIIKIAYKIIYKIKSEL